MSVSMEITMSDELKDELDRICDDSGQTISTLFRKALALYLEAHRRTKSGETMLCFYDADTREIDGQVIGLH